MGEKNKEKVIFNAFFEKLVDFICLFIWSYVIYVVSLYQQIRKERDIINHTTMTRALSNGYTYEVVQNFLGGYSLYYKDERASEFKRSTTSFRSLTEAEEWFETMEANYLSWKNKPASQPLDCSRYYAEAPRGTYFGD